MVARLSYLTETPSASLDARKQIVAGCPVERFAKAALDRFTESAAEHFIEHLTSYLTEGFPETVATQSSLTLAKVWIGEPVAERPASTLLLALSLGDRDHPLEFTVDLADAVTDVLDMHINPDTGLLDMGSEDRQALEAIADMFKTQAARIEHALDANTETTDDL